MNKMNYKIEVLENKIKESLKTLGYELDNVTINPSNRPDLGDYQFNGIMPLAKTYHKNPVEIANELVPLVKEYEEIKEASVAGPGFINLTFSDNFLIDFMNESNKNIEINYNLGINKTIFLDYGGPNVAKVLHVGHLRSGNIGEALKRLCEAVGCKTISDVHLGDWGRPMGMVILEIKTRHPELAYFKEDYSGEEVDFEITNDDLLELYPIATTKAKEDEAIMEEARKINLDLQNKHIGYYSLWKKIAEVSINEVKRIYKDLNVSFDLWEGESNSYDYIDAVFKYLYSQNIVEESEGAQVIDVKKDDDKIEVPPLILVKSNGAASYAATDLAAIWERTRNYPSDEIWYLTDKRQELHFNQVFRASYKSKMVDEKIKLIWNGFGTMNGPDGKPFKTRDGGVMPLSTLLDMVTAECEKRLMDSITENRYETARTIAVAAIKYADLLPFRTTDYNFDIEKFTDLNGKTGTYLLYSTIRMKSLLNKAKEAGVEFNDIIKISTEAERKIILAMLDLRRIIKRSFENCSLNEIAEYLYKITNLYNNFYAENKIIPEENSEVRASWLALSNIIYNNNLYLLNLLGINIPEKM
ncbi:MAG: arginine--tRNA ligase [Firmicutes bacterium]|nr:arginine--tRNA ligase [Bacillota bacterium]